MSVQDKQQDKPTMTARLAELEASVATAIAKQRELREAKEAAVRDVRDKQEALVRALAEDLDGAATVEQKALSTAEKVPRSRGTRRSKRRVA